MALNPRPQTAIFVLTDTDGRTYGVDITTQQNYADRYIVTKHPVEEGAEVADHIQKSEATIEVSGEISNSPLHLSEEPDPRRGVTTYELLRRIADEGRTVSLATAVRSYSELAFTELRVQRGSDVSSETVRLQMSLIEIQRAKTQLATLDASLFFADFAEDVQDTAPEVVESSSDTVEASPCSVNHGAWGAGISAVTGTDWDELNECAIEQGTPLSDLETQRGSVKTSTGATPTSPDERIDYEQTLSDPDSTVGL